MSEQKNGNTETERRPSRVNRLAVTVLVLNVCTLVLLVAGWFAGWFSLSGGETGTPGQYRVQLTINPSAIEEDVESAVQATQEASETVSTAVELETFTGDVLEYREESGQLVVSNEEQDSLVANLSDVTEFETEHEGDSPRQFSQGDAVQVIYREADEANVAIKVRRLSP